MPRAPADGSSRWAVVGDPAPEIALRALDGGTLRLSTYAGRVVVVMFWDAYCGPCRDELPVLEALRARHEDIVILAVSIDDVDSDDAVRDLVVRLHLGFPVLRDPEGHTAFQYMRIAATPLTGVVGRDGRLRALHRGYLPPLAERLEQEVQAALSDSIAPRRL